MGCLSADDRLIAGAQTIARGLARNPPKQGGSIDRARDLGWPLLELEAWLRFREDPICTGAADRTALAILSRFDARARVFRFGEGERRGGFYEERAWITGGILVPALRAHLARRPGRKLRQLVEGLERRLASLAMSGRRGLPVRYLTSEGLVLREVRQVEVPELYLLLEGLAPRQLARALGRQTVRTALGQVPDQDDPDLATSFSKVARCWWVLR